MKDNIVRDKSFAFALRVVKLAKYLQDEKREFVLSKQVLRNGIRDMIRRCREAGLLEPIFAVTDGFVATVWRRSGDVTGEATGEVTGEVAGEVMRLLLVCQGEMTRRQMQSRLSLKGDDNFRRLYLVPALEAGLIEMTIPDKPTSRMQKYRLTAAGAAKLNQLPKGRNDS